MRLLALFTLVGIGIIVFEPVAAMLVPLLLFTLAVAVLISAVKH
ncbi:hypothetical protein [Amycolatopsis lexingtonensis]|nr:hypothetical protein [Amycolatopsis lexingtonensis]